MGHPKKQILKALSDSHLRAIGLVAAQWAQLELTLISILSKTSNIPVKQTLILAGAQNATAWCDMLHKLTYEPHALGKPKVKTSLDPIRQRIADLQAQRNTIVHTAWFEPKAEIPSGLFGDIPRARIRASQTAEGAGIPKRGNKIVTITSYSAKEMLAVASKIEKVELDVSSWHHQQQPTSRLIELLRTPSSHSIPVKNLKPQKTRLKSSPQIKAR